MRFASLLVVAALCQISLAGDPPKLADALSGKLKEPAYQHTPKYCLMVFGPKADTKVWLVEDGDVLYVDRNADGDLTASDESFAATEIRDLGSYQDQKYEVGELSLAKQWKDRTDLLVTRFRSGDEAVSYVLKLKVDDTLHQYAGWRPIFADKREQATVLHFGAPLIAQPIREKTLLLSEVDRHLSIRFATPGHGEHSFASLAYEAVPDDAHPIAEIEWPAKPGTGPAISKVTLDHRC